MWHIVLGPFFAAFGVFMVVFLWRELRDSRALLLIGFWCLVLAIGLDVVDGMDMLIGSSHLARTTEEFVEMLGFSILWLALLKHLLRLTPSVTIVVAAPPSG